MDELITRGRWSPLHTAWMRTLQRPREIVWRRPANAKRYNIARDTTSARARVCIIADRVNGEGPDSAATKAAGFKSDQGLRETWQDQSLSCC